MSAAVVDTAETASATTHPATVYFARQLQALAQANKVCMLDTGGIHRLTARRLYTLTPGHFVPDPTEQSPDLN